MDEAELQKQLLSEFKDYESEHEVDENSTNGNKTETYENKFRALVLISFIWIQGLRSNSNLMYVPDEQQMYCANGENRSYDALRFRCYSTNCQCKVYLRKDGTAYSESHAKHNHGKMYEKYKEMECVNSMKKLCLTAPASTTVREIYDQSVLEYVFRNIS